MGDQYDAIVIGAGVSGALVAWKLAGAKSKVLLIDAGESRLGDADRKAFVKTFAEASQSAKTPSEPYVDSDNSRFAHSPDVADFKLFRPGDSQAKRCYLLPNDAISAWWRRPDPDLHRNVFRQQVGELKPQL